MNGPSGFPQEYIDRFWSRVNKTDTCWLWTRGRTNGYGVMWVADRTILAHRISFQITHGPIEGAQIIDHICHVRNCVNPAHLRPVTHKQNMENRKGAQRNNRTSGLRGVSYDKSTGKWRATVYSSGKVLQLGSFATIEEADLVAKSKRLEIYTHNDADRLGHTIGMSRTDITRAAGKSEGTIRGLERRAGK